MRSSPLSSRPPAEGKPPSDQEAGWAESNAVGGVGWEMRYMHPATSSCRTAGHCCIIAGHVHSPLSSLSGPEPTPHDRSLRQACRHLLSTLTTAQSPAMSTHLLAPRQNLPAP